MEHTTVFAVGEQLKDICRDDPGCAAIVAEDLANEAMSIKACEKAIKAEADKIAKEKKLRAVGISSQTAETIIRKFYGLPDRAEEKKEPAPKPQEETMLLGLEDLL